MATVIFITPDEREHVVEVADGTTLMEAAVTNDVAGIVGECGGSAMCATCHCYVDEEFLGRLEPIDEIEDEMLEVATAPRTTRSRLSCQLKSSPAFDGMIVRIPETQV